MTLTTETIALLNTIKESIDFLIAEYGHDLPEMEADTLAVASTTCAELVAAYSEPVRPDRHLMLVKLA